jgi:hypothetical protein
MPGPHHSAHAPTVWGMICPSIIRVISRLIGWTVRPRHQTRRTTMTQTTQTPRETTSRPHWIAKIPKQIGRKERLERVGVGWNREDGGICLRLHGTQIVSDDVYLYPNTPQDTDAA